MKKTVLFLVTVFAFGDDARNKWPVIPEKSRTLIEVKINSSGQDFDLRRRIIAEPSKGNVWEIRDDDSHEVISYQKKEPWKLKAKADDFAGLNKLFEKRLKSRRR